MEHVTLVHNRANGVVRIEAGMSSRDDHRVPPPVRAGEQPDDIARDGSEIRLLVGGSPGVVGRRGPVCAR
jgi:hypothetical protein